MHELPHGERELGVLPPRFLGDLHELPRPPGRPQHGGLHELSPEHRDELALQPPVLDELQLVPLRAGEPLRDIMLVVPHAEPVMERCDVLAPGGSRRRAHLPQLRVCELPPQRVL